MRQQFRPQQGLSLIGVAIFMALLALAAMAALYWMRFERNPITDIMNGTVQRPFGKITKPAGAPNAATSGTAAQPSGPAPLSSEVRKCIINGKTVFSDTDCPKSAEKMKLHNNSYAPPPKPASTDADADASATLSQKAMDRAINQSTK
ncbi:MAG: hypothetical protein RL748_1686 [Pseudomonadota bacterium]